MPGVNIVTPSNVFTNKVLSSAGHKNLHKHGKCARKILDKVFIYVLYSFYARIIIVYDRGNAPNAL